MQHLKWPREKEHRSLAKYLSWKAETSLAAPSQGPIYVFRMNLALENMYAQPGIGVGARAQISCPGKELSGWAVPHGRLLPGSSEVVLRQAGQLQGVDVCPLTPQRDNNLAFGVVSPKMGSQRQKWDGTLIASTAGGVLYLPSYRLRGKKSHLSATISKKNSCYCRH